MASTTCAGRVDDEVLISCHICHPSLANDNLSGMALVAHLARHLSSRPRRYSYRFLFIPGTIGSITWLARNEERASRIRHGLVVTCVGDPGPFTYKREPAGRRGDRSGGRARPRDTREGPTRFATFRPMDTTSGSSARPVSTCRWGA